MKRLSSDTIHTNGGSFLMKKSALLFSILILSGCSSVHDKIIPESSMSSEALNERITNKFSNEFNKHDIQTLYTQTAYGDAVWICTPDRMNGPDQCDARLARTVKVSMPAARSTHGTFVRYHPGTDQVSVHFREAAKTIPYARFEEALEEQLLGYFKLESKHLGW